MATTVTKTIGATGDYSTVSAWEAATDNDLVTADEVQVGNVLNETVTDTATVTFAGATIDATRFRRLKAATNFDIDDRSGSVITNSLSTSAVTYIVNEPGFELIGLGIARTASTGYVLQVINTDSSLPTTRQLVEKCTIDANTSSTDSKGVVLASGTSARESNLNFWNNIIICDEAGDGLTGLAIGEAVASGITVRIHNNLIVDFDKGGSTPGNNVTVIDGTNSGTILVTNNVSMNAGGSDWASMNIIGGTHTEDYNAASDTTAAGTNSIDSVATSAFEDFAGYDFTPASSGALEDAGEDLSAQFTDDYYGTTRSGTWDIGPIERTVSTQTLTPGAVAMPFEVAAPTMSFGAKTISASAIEMPFVAPQLASLRFKVYADDSFHVHGSPLAKDTSTSNEDIGWDDTTDTSVRTVIRVPFTGLPRNSALTGATFSIYKSGESGAQSNTVDGDLHYYGATNPGEDDASSDDAATAHNKAAGVDPPIQGNFPTGTDADGELTTAAFDATNLNVLQRCLFAVNRVTFGIHDDSALVQEGRVLIADAVDSANPPYMVLDFDQTRLKFAPDAVAMPFVPPDATRDLGVVNVAPGTVEMPFVVPAATASMGVLNVAPGTVAMPLAVATPALAFGATTIAASAVAMPFAVPSPTMAFGATTVAASAVAMPFAAPAPTMVFGTKTIASGAVAMPFVVPVATVSQSGGETQFVYPSAIAMPFVVPAATRTLGNINVAPGIVTMPFEVPVATRTLGGIAVAPGVATMPLEAPVATRTLGGINVAPGTVAMPLASPAATVDLTLNVAPGVATMPLAVPAASVATGTLTLAPNAVAIGLAVPQVSLLGVVVPRVLHTQNVYLSIAHEENTLHGVTHEENTYHSITSEENTQL